MPKRKSLTDMNFDFTEDEAPAPAPAQERDTQGAGDFDLDKKWVGLNFRVEAHERQELKEWCARHNMTQREVLFAGFELLKKYRGN